jgi:sugar (pentulose or hexulose) kinase
LKKWQIGCTGTAHDVFFTGGSAKQAILRQQLADVAR